MSYSEHEADPNQRNTQSTKLKLHARATLYPHTASYGVKNVTFKKVALSWILLLLTISNLLYGCRNNEKSQELTALQQENQRLKENLRQERLAAGNGLNQSAEASVPSKYSYVILFIEQTEGYPPEVVKSKHISKITPVYEEVNADIASRLMDKVQDDYLNSIDARMKKGKVLRRGFMYYDTYSQASDDRARELAE